MRKKYQTPLLSAALIALATPSAMAVPEPTPIVAPQPQGLCTGTVLDENGVNYESIIFIFTSNCRFTAQRARTQFYAFTYFNIIKF